MVRGWKSEKEMKYILSNGKKERRKVNFRGPLSHSGPWKELEIRGAIWGEYKTQPAAGVTAAWAG